MSKNYTMASLLVAIAMIAAWEFLPTLLDIPSYIIPTFSETMNAHYEKTLGKRYVPMTAGGGWLGEQD